MLSTRLNLLLMLQLNHSPVKFEVKESLRARKHFLEINSFFESRANFFVFVIQLDVNNTRFFVNMFSK